MKTELEDLLYKDIQLASYVLMGNTSYSKEVLDLFEQRKTNGMKTLTKITIMKKELEKQIEELEAKWLETNLEIANKIFALNELVLENNPAKELDQWGDPIV